jgi:hypothetical protein
MAQRGHPEGFKEMVANVTSEGNMLSQQWFGIQPVGNKIANEVSPNHFAMSLQFPYKVME